jgi:hypothetical protein
MILTSLASQTAGLSTVSKVESNNIFFPPRLTVLIYGIHGRPSSEDYKAGKEELFLGIKFFLS